MNVVKNSIVIFLLVASYTHAQKLDQKAWQEAAALTRQGQHSKALEKYKDALESVRDLSLFHQAASALQQSGAAGQPEQLYLWGRSHLKDKKAFARELAELYHAQLSYSKAIPQWALVLETQPDYARIRLMETAEVYGFLATAQALEKALQKKNDSARLVLGNLYRKAGDYNRALDSYNTLTAKDQWLQAVTALASGPGPDLDQQAEIITRILKQEPPDKIYWQRLLAANYQKQGASAQALKLYETLGDAEAVFHAARIYYEKMHLPRKALDRLGSAISGWPDSLKTPGLFLKAACLVALDQADSANAVYARLSDSLNPPQLRQPACFHLGELELMRQDFERAMEWYRQAILPGPQDDAVNDALARLLLITGYKTDKINILTVWSRGLKFQRRFDFDQAAGCYQQVIAADSGGQLQAVSLQSLAQMAAGRGQFKEAGEYWQQLSESAPDSALAAETFYQRGLMLRDRLEDRKRAVQVWEQGVIAYPNTSWADLMREELEKSKTRNQK